MYKDNELLFFLPSRQQKNLAKAIGRRLLEIERFFGIDLQSFLQYTCLEKEDFFTHNSGAVQFCFEEDLIQPFAVYGEQLSIVLLPESLANDDFTQKYQLSRFDFVPILLKNCLGKVCQDVRIWTLKEDFESEEAKEVAVSYVFSNEQELFYCIYLHEDLDSDYLLLGKDVPRERVATCYSIRDGKYIDPKQSINSCSDTTTSFTY